jgi:hypothetical protein
MKLLVRGLLSACLVASGAVWIPTGTAEAAVTETITVDDVNIKHCEKSSLLGAAIEIKYYGRVAATRKAWGYPATHDYYVSVENPRVVSSFFSVKTYNKCGKGRKAKKVKDTFTVVSAWTGVETKINWDASVGLSLPKGVSFGGSASLTNEERTVREKNTAMPAKRVSWTSVMNTKPLKWTSWKAIEHATTPDADFGTIMKVYAHPIVRWNAKDGSDFFDWDIETANLR